MKLFITRKSVQSEVQIKAEQFLEQINFFHAKAALDKVNIGFENSRFFSSVQTENRF